MRRTPLTVMALLGLAGLLAGCGGASTESGRGDGVEGQVRPVPGATSPASTTTSTVSSVPATSSVPVASSATSPKDVVGSAAAAPEVRVRPGAMMSGEGYLRAGSGTDFQFTAGTLQCVMTATVAGCVGDLPEPGKSGVQVTADGAAAFLDDGPARLKVKGTAKELPVARSLHNGVFVCTPVAGDGVQCETAAAAHGFQVLPAKSWLW